LEGVAKSVGVLACIENCRRGRLRYALRMGFCDTLFMDWAAHKALRPGESAVAAGRGEPDAQVLGKRRWRPPSLGFNSTAPLCRHTPKSPESI